MKQIILATVVFCLFFVTVGHAQISHYLGLETGFFFPSGSINNYENNYKFQTGTEMGLKYIRYFNENLGVILRFWSVNEFKSDEKNFDYGGNSGKAHYEIAGLGLGLGLALKFSVNDRVSFIASGAVLNYNTYIETFISKGYQAERSSDSGVTIGYCADVGLRFHLLNWLALEAIFKYTINEPYISGEKIDMGGMSALLSLGLTFD